MHLAQFLAQQPCHGMKPKQGDKPLHQAFIPRVAVADVHQFVQPYQREIPVIRTVHHQPTPHTESPHRFVRPHFRPLLLPPARAAFHQPPHAHIPQKPENQHADGSGTIHDGHDSPSRSLIPACRKFPAKSRFRPTVRTAFRPRLRQFLVPHTQRALHGTLPLHRPRHKGHAQANRHSPQQ